MKIAISTTGKTLDSPVEPRFGRSPGYILFDTDTQDLQYLDNAAQQRLAQGAGIQAAQMVIDAGAEALITGQVGPKAAQVLDQSKIRIYGAAGGTVREAIDALTENRLNPLSADDAAPAKWAGQGTGCGGLGRGPAQGGRGMGGGGRGRGPAQGGRGMGGGGRGKGPAQGGRGMGGGGRGRGTD
jgi:predicted Fe-Mo cluster-binding NifX family protein